MALNQFLMDKFYRHLVKSFFEKNLITIFYIIIFFFFLNQKQIESFHLTVLSLRKRNLTRKNRFCKHRIKSMIT